MKIGPSLVNRLNTPRVSNKEWGMRARDFVKFRESCLWCISGLYLFQIWFRFMLVGTNDFGSGIRGLAFQIVYGNTWIYTVYKTAYQVSFTTLLQSSLPPCWWEMKMKIKLEHKLKMQRSEGNVVDGGQTQKNGEFVKIDRAR